MFKLPLRRSILLPLAAALLSTAALAQPPHGADQPFHHSPMMAALQQVNLSEAQKQAIHQIMESRHDELRSMHDSERQLHETLLKLDPRNADYTAQVGDIAQQAAAHAAQRVQLMAQIKSDVYGTLTDAQKTQLTAALATMKLPHEMHEAPPSE